MERLLEDAEKLSGIEFNIDSFADVTEAIHVIQENMGITGATAKEAATTIEGSAKAAEAAWQNLLTGLADPTQDLNKLIDEFIEAKTTQIQNVLPAVEYSIEGIGKAIDKLIPELDGAGEKLAEMVTQDMIPALIDGLKWLADNGDIVANALKAIAAQFVVSTVIDYGNGIGTVLSGLNGLAGNADNVVDGLENISVSLMNGVTSFNLYGAAIAATAVLATALAAEINKAAREIKEASKYANFFTDLSNDALDRYAEIANASGEEAQQMAAEWIDADKAALQSAQSNLQNLRHAMDEIEKLSDEEIDWNVYNDLSQQIQQAERDVEVLNNIVFAEEKFLGELNDTVDEGLTQIEATVDEHAKKAEEMRQASIQAAAGGEEGLETFESRWDRITHWEKEEFDGYWTAKKDWLEKHKENTEWWWNEYHKVEDHYEKEAENKRKEKEQAEKDAENQRQKQRNEALKAQAEAESKLKQDTGDAMDVLENRALREGWDDQKLLDEKRAYIEEHLDKSTALYREYDTQILKAQQALDKQLAQERDRAAKQEEQEKAAMVKRDLQNIENLKYTEGRTELEILAMKRQYIEDYLDHNSELYREYNDKLIKEQSEAEERAAKQAESDLKAQVQERFRDLETEQLENGYDDKWLLEQKKAFIETLDHNSEVYKDYHNAMLKEDEKYTNKLEQNAEKQRNALEKSYEKVVRARDQLADSVKSAADGLFSSKSVKDPRTGAVDTENTLQIAEFKRKLAAKKQLPAKLARLIDKGAPDSFIKDLLKLDPTAALEYVNELLGSQSELNDIIKGYKTDSDISTKIADMLTEDSEDFAELGKETGAAFGDEFIKAFSEDWEKACKEIFADPQVMQVMTDSVQQANASVYVPTPAASASAEAEAQGTAHAQAAVYPDKITMKVTDADGKYIATLVNEANDIMIISKGK